MSNLRIARGYRTCRWGGCNRHAISGTVYCPDHSEGEEARAFQSQSHSASDRLPPTGYNPHDVYADPAGVHGSGPNSWPGHYLDLDDDNEDAALNAPLVTVPDDYWERREHEAERKPAPAPARSASVARQVADEQAAERRRREIEFSARVEGGEYNLLLTEAVNAILDQAAEQRDFRREMGALRLAIARTIAEEPDNHRMALTIARTVNAMARLVVAEYAVRDPKPVVRYGQEWSPELPHEDLVRYIWRHRPKDFEERYMARVSPDEEFPANLFHPIKEDHQRTRDYDRGTDEEGKLLPPPMPVERLGEIDARNGIEREYAERTWWGEWVPLLDAEGKERWEQYKADRDAPADAYDELQRQRVEG